jgi:hypothetical protein
VATVLEIGGGSRAEPLLPQASSTPEWLDQSHRAGRCSVAESHAGGRNGNGAGNAATPALPDVEVTWSFRLSGKIVRWSWRRNGSPPLILLQPVRRPWSSDRARHRPVTAFSTTNNDHVELESGEEHDLVRVCDRDPEIAHLISQPFRLTWKSGGGGAHTPDLVAVDRTGAVTAWDARPADEQDEDFWSSVAITRAACHAVGWSHQVFSGLSQIERLNLLWLHGFRRAPTWLEAHQARLRKIAGSGGATIAELFSHDDGTGELKSTVWHLIWRGLLTVNLRRPITQHTRVEWNGDVGWPMAERR